VCFFVVVVRRLRLLIIRLITVLLHGISRIDSCIGLGV
jgi:hypothetical protein